MCSRVDSCKTVGWALTTQVGSRAGSHCSEWLQSGLRLYLWVIERDQTVLNGYRVCSGCTGGL